jgi:hypothetical protein
VYRQRRKSETVIRVEREIILSLSKGEFERSTGPQNPSFDMAASGRTSG